jgi:hypothetical protein
MDHDPKDQQLDQSLTATLNLGLAALIYGDIAGGTSACSSHSFSPAPWLVRQSRAHAEGGNI